MLFLRRIQNAVEPDYPVFALVLLQAITSPLVGAANAIAYGLDKGTRDKLNRKSVIKVCCRHVHQVFMWGRETTATLRLYFFTKNVGVEIAEKVGYESCLTFRRTDRSKVGLNTFWHSDSTSK